MRKIVSLVCLLILLLALFCLASCSLKCTATLYIEDGKCVIMELDRGTVPKAPVCADSRQSFAGWYLDPDFKKAYSGKGITGDITLYAKWVEGSGRLVELIVKGVGAEYDSATVYVGSTYGELEKPHREGFTFLGWSKTDGGELLAEEDRITGIGVIYAVWEPDAVDFINRVSTEAVKATVGVNTTRYSYNFLVPSNISGGSGAIIRETDSYYYFLTNSHVIEQKDGFDAIRYSVMDCYGGVYDAFLVAKATEYDLALLRFNKGEKKLGVLEFGSDPKENQLLASVGYPTSISNTVTLGRLLAYDRVDISDGSSRIDFAVGVHDAPTDHGSSGGAVLNSDLLLVGINFAYAPPTEDRDPFAVFVQSSKIIEFLTNVGFI